MNTQPYNRKSIKVITGPATLAVSLSDMKDYLRVDDTSDDDLITAFLNASIESIKEEIKRSLITETLEFTLDWFQFDESYYQCEMHMGGAYTGYSRPFRNDGYSSYIDIPYSPIQSITTLNTFDRANTESTLSSSVYELDERGGRIYLNDNQVWPADLRDREAVKIRYVAGYGDNPSDIPAPITQSIKMHVGNMYDCRDACEIPKACMAMLTPYKRLDYLEWI